MSDIILPYGGVGLVIPHSTGEAMIGGVKTPMGELAALAPMERTVQPCRVPDRHKNPAAVWSALELAKLSEPKNLGALSGGIVASWIVNHWIENETMEKIQTWETWAFPADATPEHATAGFSDLRAVWKKHGYFCLKEYAANVAAEKRAAEGAKLRKLVLSNSLKPKMNYLPPIVDEYEAQLNAAAWEHLRPMMPNTVDAKLAGKHAEAVQYFAKEIDLPNGQLDQINGIILRELNFAKRNNLPPPSDKTISEVLKAAGFTVKPDAVKHRRQQMGLSGFHQPGPKPKTP